MHKLNENVAADEEESGETDGPVLDGDTGRRLSAEEKGKGKAIDRDVELTGTHELNENVVADEEDEGGTDGPVFDGETGRRLSAEEKGKGKAIDCDVELSEVKDDVGPDGGRGKRVRRKRRLSADGEIDPNDLNADGSVNKKARRKSNIRANGQTSKAPILCAADKLYFARLEENAKRPALNDMKGPCPLWAKTRKALQSVAEYLRDPGKTIGACVDIGVGGVARGVILEGAAHEQRAFWGTGAEAGTIITSM